MGLREPYCRCKPFKDPVPCYRCETCGELRNDAVGELVSALDGILNETDAGDWDCPEIIRARAVLARVKEEA